MRKSFTGSRGSRDALGTGSRDEPVSGIKMERRLYRLADFEVKDTIGVGAFARVRIARHILDDVHQALKIVKKLECVRLKQFKHFQQEVSLLQQCSDSPFVVQARVPAARRAPPTTTTASLPRSSSYAGRGRAAHLRARGRRRAGDRRRAAREDRDDRALL